MGKRGTGGPGRKSDPEKIALAKDLRSQTTISLEMVSAPLGNGIMDTPLQSSSPIT